MEGGSGGVGRHVLQLAAAKTKKYGDESSCCCTRHSTSQEIQDWGGGTMVSYKYKRVFMHWSNARGSSALHGMTSSGGV